MQSSRLIPRVMVRTSRFSCSIILLVSFTSNILIIAYVFLSSIMKLSSSDDIFNESQLSGTFLSDSMHYVENILVLTVDHYADLIPESSQFLGKSCNFFV